MNSVTPSESVVKEGTFLYDHRVECDVRIVMSPVHYGTGDYEDPPDIANDRAEATFYIQYGSTIQRGVFSAGGGGFASLEEAIAEVASAPGIGSTVKWVDLP